MNKISINHDQTWDCYSKLSAYILDLLCGFLLSGNKIIGKHLQVNFSNNLELILMKLSTFMEFAEIISTCEAYPQRIEWDSLSRPLRKCGRRRSLAVLAMKVVLKFLCFVIGLKWKHLAKIDNWEPFFWARNFLKQEDRLKLWDLNLDSDFI